MSELTDLQMTLYWVGIFFFNLGVSYLAARYFNRRNK